MIAFSHTERDLVATHDFNDLRRTRAAKNQNLFRYVNERVESIAKYYNLGDPLEFICECADLDCSERLQMRLREYEAVRGVSTHFAIAVGHEIPEVERVVERATGYLVVEKMGVAWRLGRGKARSSANRAGAMRPRAEGPSDPVVQRARIVLQAVGETIADLQGRPDNANWEEQIRALEAMRNRLVAELTAAESAA